MVGPGFPVAAVYWLLGFTDIDTLIKQRTIKFLISIKQKKKKISQFLVDPCNILLLLQIKSQLRFEICAWGYKSILKLSFISYINLLTFSVSKKS